jgi:hypothetical protein
MLSWPEPGESRLRSARLAGLHKMYLVSKDDIFLVKRVVAEKVLSNPPFVLSFRYDRWLNVCYGL